MTREEFDREITSWSELKGFCYDNDISVCDCIYDIDELTDMVSNIISSRNSYDALCKIQELIEDLYLDDEYFEVIDGTACSADFDNYKQSVAEAFEEYDEWDDEDDEEDEDIDDSYEEKWYEDESIPGDIDTGEFESIIVN